MPKTIKSIIFLFASFIFLTGCNDIKIEFVDYNDELIAISSLNQDGSVNMPDNPVREGYTFIGWDKELENIQESLRTMALYSANEYEINFIDANQKRVVLYNSVVTDEPIPVKPGYTFLVWELDGAEISFPFTYNYTKDIVLIAKFQKNSLTYTVSFYADDGDVLKKEIVLEGKPANPPKAPDKTGYQFLGWDKDLENINSNLSVKAIYEPFSFVINFDYPNIEPKNIKYDEVVEFIELTKAGYIFDGWFLDDVKVDNPLVYNYLKDINLKPKFRADNREEVKAFFDDIDSFMNDASSYRLTTDLKVKEKYTDDKYLIFTKEISNLFPSKYYIDTKIYNNDVLQSFTIQTREQDNIYAYNIISSEFGKPSIYKKELIGSVDDFVFEENNYEFLYDLPKELTYIKKAEGYYSIVGTVEQYGILDLFGGLIEDISEYKDVLVEYEFMYNDQAKTLVIRMKMIFDVIIQMEFTFDNYNKTIMINPNNSSEYEPLAGTSSAPEMITDLGKVITKHQGLKGAATVYTHYYQANFSEGYYLFDLDLLPYEWDINSYELYFYNTINGLGVSLEKITNTVSIDHDRLFYLKEGEYKFKICGNHKFGYSFNIRKLDYVSYDGFSNPQKITNTISGEVEGIYDLNVYEYIVEEDAQLLIFTNLPPNIMIICFYESGSYTDFLDLGDEYWLEVRPGKNTIIITGRDELIYNINVEVKKID